MELGTTATAYEAYNGASYPIDWTNDAGELYGGYVDVVNGTLTKTWEAVDLGTLTWDTVTNANNNVSWFRAYKQMPGTWFTDVDS